MILSDEQRALRETARRFAERELLPGYQKREAHGRLDNALTRQLGELGLIAPELPEQYGALGVSGLTAGIVIEQIAWGDINVSYVPLMASLTGKILAGHAPPEIAETWLPAMIRGEKIVGLGLTEPRGGSDAANLALKARRDGSYYIFNGEKTSISFADQADALVLFARTGSAEDGAHGVSTFLVPLDLPGVQRTHFNDSGSRIVGRGSVFFDDVRVPANHLIGAEGKGFIQVMQGFDYSRVLIALQCIGSAQASLDEAWAYTKERQAFGVPLAQYQGVTFPLAEYDALLDAARQLSYHALDLRDHGEGHTAEAAMVKWLGPKTAVDTIHQCLLTFGHYGWSLDLPHQQRLRDVMGLEIGDGTAQIMKLIVARERVGRVAVQYAKDKRP